MNTKFIIELTKEETETFMSLLKGTREPVIIAKERKDSEIIRVPDLCKLTGWAASTIYRMTSQKTIPFKRKGRTVFFERSKIMEWLQDDQDLNLNDKA